MKAKAEGRADGAGGIAGEIKKYLTGECHHAEPGIERNERTGVTKIRSAEPESIVSASTIFSNKPSFMSSNPHRNWPARKPGAVTSCGRKSPARTIGPATS